MQLKALLFLVALTAILPELFSGNTPLPQLLTAESVVIFLLAYGLPVVFIRDWAVRTGAGALGIFVMGLGYGLINEGLYARTIFRLTDVPVDTFDGYSFALGVNWGWAAFICVWHALSSVLAPITLTHFVFPPAGPWLQRWAFTLWGLVMAGAASGFFLLIGRSPVEGELGVVANEPVALVLQWLAILTFWIIGSRLPAGSARASVRKVLPLVIGLSGALAFILCAIPSDQGWPVPTTFLVLGTVVLAYAWALRGLRLTALAPLSWFAFGWYLNVALLSWTVMWAASPVTVLADALLLAAFLVVLLNVSKRKTADLPT